MEINVFPSELIVDETAITDISFSLTKYFNAVRTDLKDSASDDPGFSTTGNLIFTFTVTDISYYRDFCFSFNILFINYFIVEKVN